jgi:phage terminase large subunit-like protein
MQKVLQTSLLKRMMRDRGIRKELTTESFFYFFHLYYAHYIKYETADFQKEIMDLLEKSKENLFITAFRGSGKSTMVTTAYPIWAILGKHAKKFVVIFCQTKAQAKQHMMNLRNELENNQLLKKDLGPFQEESDEWGSYSLVFKKHGARITVASSEQSIRGIRHNEHRPDLIICDDVEDAQSAKTREGRDKTYGWLKSEVVPIGDRSTRLIVVGNLLHQDSLLMRIRGDIEARISKGIFKQYPLLDEKDQCMWPGKYPTSADIEEEKAKVGNEVSWQREYLLRIISTEQQLIHREWIQYYDVLPDKKHKGYRATYLGVDLAISSSDTADYTAFVTAHLYSRCEKMRIYILPNPIVKRLSFPEQVDVISGMSTTVLTGKKDTVFVESVGYQDALTHVLTSQNINAESVRPKGEKRIRLGLTATLIRSGIIKFPRTGCEELIEQIVGFGVEKYDDIADAFSLLINATMEKHAGETNNAGMYCTMYDGAIVLYASDYVDVD